MRKYGESKTTRIMMAIVPHVSSGLGLRKFQADGFLLTRVYRQTFVVATLVRVTVYSKILRFIRTITEPAELGPYNDWGNGWTAEELWVDFPPCPNIFFLSTNPRPAVEPTQSPIRWVKWNFPRGKPTEAWI